MQNVVIPRVIMESVMAHTHARTHTNTNTHTQAGIGQWSMDRPGSAISKGRNPSSYLGQVFNFTLVVLFQSNVTAWHANSHF